MLALSNISRRLILKQLPLISQCSTILNVVPSSTVIAADYSLYQHDNRLCSISNKLPTDFVSKRYKSKKKNDKRQDDEEDSDTEEDLSQWKDDDSSLDKDSKVTVAKVASMRADTVIKGGLGISRAKVEHLFYENKIRKNDTKLTKKSATLYIGDQIDIIKGFNVSNPKNLNISRLELLDGLERKDGINLTMRVFKNLVIENYAESPFELGDTNPDA